MTYYLIDYENTGENGLEGIEDLESGGRVIIFYSENADKMSFDLHQRLRECRAGIEFKKIKTGKKNALDFQLATYLGYLIAKDGDSQFCIVSKDLGYEVLLEFWKEQGIQLIDGIFAREKEKVKQSGSPQDKLQSLIPNEEERKVAADCLTRCKTKQEINNILVRRFGSEKAGELYKKIKPLIKNKKGK